MYVYIAVVFGGFLFLVDRFNSAKKRPDFLLAVFWQKNFFEALLNVMVGIILVWLSNIENNEIIIAKFNITLMVCAMVGFFAQWLVRKLTTFTKWLFINAFKYLKLFFIKLFKLS